jgi:hypothetical protein
MLSQLLRRVGGTAFAALALATAACGGDSDSTGPGPVDPGPGPVDPGPGPAPSDAQGTLYVSNNSDRSIWYVFARTCSTTSWGEDLLGSDIITKQTSGSFTLAAGCYDVRTLSAPIGGPGGAKYEVVVSNQTLPANGQLVVEVTTWPAEPSAAVASLSLVPKR